MEPLVNHVFVIIKALNVLVKRVNVSVQRKALLEIIVNDVTCLVFIMEILLIKDLVFTIWLLIINLHSI